MYNIIIKYIDNLINLMFSKKVISTYRNIISKISLFNSLIIQFIVKYT